MDTPTITPNSNFTDDIRGKIKSRKELIEALPVYMTNPDCRRWLLHKNKIPFYSNGKPRGKTDTLEDWNQLVSFEEAYAALATGKYTGLGFALGREDKGDYWQGIDLDDIWSNPELYNLKLPSYIELSPSGKGLHAIGYGRKSITLGSNGTGIEAYYSGRFFTVTGNRFNDFLGLDIPAQPICLADFIEQVLCPMHGTKISENTQITSSNLKTPIIITDELLEDLKSALQYISADDGKTWISMGYALHELGDAGYKIWAEWSATSENHKGDIDLARWDGLKADRTSHKAVFALAQANGWINPKRYQPNAADIFAEPKELPVGCDPVNQITKPLVGQPEAHKDWEFPEIIVEDVFTNHPKSPEFLIEDIMPAEAITLISGNGGTGKSMLALQLAIHLAEGQPFMGKTVKKNRVIFYSAEDSPCVIQHRFYKICKSKKLDPKNISKNILFLDATEYPSLYEETENSKRPNITLGYIKLRARFNNFNAKAIVIDNASDTFNANENSRSHVRGFIHALKSFGSVLLLAHVDKTTAKGVNNTEGYSGSTGWNNSVRSRLLLTAKDNQLSLTHQKSNYGKLSNEINMFWSSDGILINQTTDYTSIHQQTALIIVLSLISKYYDQGDYISPARGARPTAFNALKDDPNFPNSIQNNKQMLVILKHAEDSELLIREKYRNLDYKDRIRYRLTEKACKLLSNESKSNNIDPPSMII